MKFKESFLIPANEALRELHKQHTAKDVNIKLKQCSVSLCSGILNVIGSVERFEYVFEDMSYSNFKIFEEYTLGEPTTVTPEASADFISLCVCFKAKKMIESFADAVIIDNDSVLDCYNMLAGNDLDYSRVTEFIIENRLHLSVHYPRELSHSIAMSLKGNDLFEYVCFSGTDLKLLTDFDMTPENIRKLSTLSLSRFQREIIRYIVELRTK